MPIYTAQDVAEFMRTLSKWENRSLLYDKFSDVQKDAKDHDAKSNSLQRLQNAVEHADAVVACESRYHRLLAGPSAVPSRIFHARLMSRMMVNMAGGVIENAGLCLDRHFGVPYIPGTALKGLALRAALMSETDPDLIRTIFGEQDRSAEALKGNVAFLPAYPINPTRVELDVLTGHHGRYYRNEPGYEDAPDTECPIPVPFPAIAPGVEFRFVVTAASRHLDASLVEQAAAWLKMALQFLGVGAKTAAGYGWFQVDEARDAALAASRVQQQEEAGREAERATMTPAQRFAADLVADPSYELAKAKFAQIAELSPEEKSVLLRFIHEQGQKRVLNPQGNKKGAARVEKFNETWQREVDHGA